MQSIRLAMIMTMMSGALPVTAGDFHLSYPGAGMVTVHTTMTYEGKGERLIATARNESGLPIQHAKLCILSYSMKRGCLFEVGNTDVWGPGKELSWNLTSERKVPYLKHDVVVAESDDLQPFPIPARAMTNDDVLALKAAGFGDELILTKIKASVSGFGVDTPDLVKLKQAGMSEVVIQAIIHSMTAR